MKPLQSPAVPEVIDLAGDDDTAEMMKVVAATEPVDEPTPEPSAVVTELFEMIRRMEDDDSVNVDNATEISGATQRDDGDSQQEPSGRGPLGAPTATVVEEIVVAMEEDEPSRLERKLGPWVARHRDALRVWLLTLLAVYVSLFMSMLLQDGVRGLSERSLTAAVRDLLWAVLMGIIVLLAIGRHY